MYGFGLMFLHSKCLKVCNIENTLMGELSNRLYYEMKIILPVKKSLKK